MEKELDKCLRNIWCDKQNDSVVWDSSLRSGDHDAWRQLRGELRDVGISDDSYCINDDFIISQMKDANFGSNSPHLITARHGSMDISDFTKIGPPVLHQQYIKCRKRYLKEPVILLLLLLLLFLCSAVALFQIKTNV